MNHRHQWRTGDGKELRIYRGETDTGYSRTHLFLNATEAGQKLRSVSTRFKHEKKTFFGRKRAPQYWSDENSRLRWPIKIKKRMQQGQDDYFAEVLK